MGGGDSTYCTEASKKIIHVLASEVLVQNYSEYVF